MANYNSVKNTAKNGKLIRAEIREYVLAISMFFGLYKNRAMSHRLYQNDKHRQEQCTFLTIKKNRKLDPILNKKGNEHLLSMPQYMDNTFRSYFKYKTRSNKMTTFNDCKKLNIYYKRLIYGKRKTVRLKHTIQYIWTPFLATIICLYGKHSENNIDINDFWLYRKATDINDNDRNIYNYFRKIKIDAKVINGIIKFRDESEYNKFWDMVNANALLVFYKLNGGNYLIGKDQRKTRSNIS